VNLSFLKSIQHSVVEHPIFTALLAVSLFCAFFLWSKGRAQGRLIVLALIVFAICGFSFKWGLFLGGPDNWNVLVSVATLLAVLAALFSDVIEKLVYREKIRVEVRTDLIDRDHGLLCIRGRITNSGERPVRRCRMKLLRVEGEPIRIENGLLLWQGGIREPITLSPQEHLIFDIGTRNEAQDSPLRLLSYIGPNELSHDLTAGHTYKLVLAVYGDNIRTRMHTIPITVGAAADDIQIG
jgi:hypothetical protein